jgi:hypothetical protein
MDSLLAPLTASPARAANPAPDWIPAPRSVEESGVRRTLLEDLAVKVIAREREATTFTLGETLALPSRLVDEVFQKLRKSALVEVMGMSGSAYRMSLTSAGRERADDLMSQNSYVGPAPVPLAEYARRVQAQSIADDDVRPDGVRRAYADMVIDQDVVRQIGIAIASGTSMMLSGPSGTGKTSIAACIPRVFGRGVFLPYAVEVAGEIITVFDPGVHRPLDAELPADHDRRWAYCARPFVVAGGELTAEMLDLQYNPASGFYAAPPQMKANTGVFVIDDFGRQRMRPEELLNRWIVPLDRGVDFLTLHGGTKFAVPRRTSISVTRPRATRRSPTRRSSAASRTRSTSGTPNRRSSTRSSAACAPRTRSSTTPRSSTSSSSSCAPTWANRCGRASRATSCGRSCGRRGTTAARRGSPTRRWRGRVGPTSRCRSRTARPPRRRGEAAHG